MRSIDDFSRPPEYLTPLGEQVGEIIRDWDVEKHWRDIKMVQLWLGGKQLSQMEVARWFFECETL